MNGNALAVVFANRLYNSPGVWCLRACCRLDDGLTVIFGNDDWCDDRTRDEVRRFRSYLERAGSDVVGFGTDDSEFTWVLLAYVDAFAHEVEAELVRTAIAAGHRDAEQHAGRDAETATEIIFG